MLCVKQKKDLSQLFIDLTLSQVTDILQLYSGPLVRKCIT
jgi:hypothetical protein